MFIDSDINFEAEDIFRLMAWNSDPKKGIVAGIPVARKKGKTYISTLDTDEDENILMNYMGLVKAKRVATAFMIIRREVFEKLYEAHPEWRYHDEKKVGDEITAFFDFALKDGTYIGEDFLFCDRARELGFEVWIDPTIKLGHMGMEEFAGAFGEDYLYPLMKSIESKKDAA
jgi:GT2 family glycosyltransferase